MLSEAAETKALPLFGHSRMCWPDPMFNKIALFGVGLIGGSFALALKKAGKVEQVVGVERSDVALARALELGVVDQAMTSVAEAVRGADLIMIAAPVAQTASILTAIKPHLEPDTIVTDVGSTKSGVVEVARSVLGEKASQFVPGHPIAGRETNGPDAAITDLYVNRKVVLTPTSESRSELVQRVADAWRACGANIHYLTPGEHDDVFAAVSHLPHLLAYALVDNIARRPEADVLFQYAASGFRDFTRIAGSSPEMWRDITLANRAALLELLDSYIAQLHDMRDLVAASNGDAINAVYANAQKARKSWMYAVEAAEKPSKDGGD